MRLLGLLTFILAIDAAQAAVLTWRIDFEPHAVPRGGSFNVQTGYAVVTFETLDTRVVIDTDTYDGIQWWAKDYKVVMDGNTFRPDAQILPSGQPLSVVEQERLRIGLSDGPREGITFDFELQNGAFFDAMVRSDIWTGEPGLLTNGVFTPADLPIDVNGLSSLNNNAQVQFPDGTRYWAQIKSIKEVPEPASIVLVGLGLTVLGRLRRKRLG